MKNKDKCSKFCWGRSFVISNPHFVIGLYTLIYGAI